MVLSLLFFTNTALSVLYTLSLHDALPICLDFAVLGTALRVATLDQFLEPFEIAAHTPRVDRKSTRLNSSHITISYAVFCLKKKKQASRRVSIRADIEIRALGRHPTRVNDH